MSSPSKLTRKWGNEVPPDRDANAMWLAGLIGEQVYIISCLKKKKKKNPSNTSRLGAQDSHEWSVNKISFLVPSSLQSCFLQLRSRKYWLLNTHFFLFHLFKKPKKPCRETPAHAKSPHLSVTPLAAASCAASRLSPTAAGTVTNKVMALLEGGEVLIGKLRQRCTEALRINCCTEYAFPGLIGKWSGRCREGS